MEDRERERDVKMAPSRKTRQDTRTKTREESKKKSKSRRDDSDHEDFEVKDFGEYQRLYELFCHFMNELHENGLDPSARKKKKVV